MPSFLSSKKNQRFTIVSVLGGIVLVITAMVVFPHLFLALDTQLSFPQQMSTSDRAVYLQQRHEALGMKDPGPESTYVYQEIGTIRLALKDYDGALQSFKTAHQGNPKAPGPYRGMALSFLYSGVDKQAEHSFLEALKLSPHRSEYWLELGELYADRLKDMDKADQFYQRALRQNPNDSNVLQAYANFLGNKKNDFTKAIQIWKEIQKRNPDHAGDYNKVIEELRKRK